MSSDGLKKHYLYNTWHAMFERCYNPNHNGYCNYGARGIVVCDRWFSFKNFIDDMGDKPRKDFSIYRINPDGNYEPSNCKWSTMKEQAANMRKEERVKAKNRLYHMMKTKKVNRTYIPNMTISGII